MGRRVEPRKGPGEWAASSPGPLRGSARRKFDCFSSSDNRGVAGMEFSAAIPAKERAPLRGLRVAAKRTGVSPCPRVATPKIGAASTFHRISAADPL